MCKNILFLLLKKLLKIIKFNFQREKIVHFKTMFCHVRRDIFTFCFKKFLSEQIINEVDMDMAIGTTRRGEKCFLKLELKEKDISVVKTDRKAKFKFFSIENTRNR